MSGGGPAALGPLYLSWAVLAALLVSSSLPAHIPRSAVLFSFGFLAAGMMSFDNHAKHGAMELALPFLVFGEALRTEFASLKKVLAEVAFFGLAGYLLMALVIGVCLCWLLPDWPLFAVATLTATLLATDNELGHELLAKSEISPQILSLVSGEALISDAVVIVLFSAASSGWLRHRDVDVLGFAADFARLCVAGCSLGLALGAATLAFVHWRPAARGHGGSGDSGSGDLQVVTSAVCAWTSFSLAEKLGFSGPLACAAAGLTLNWKLVPGKTEGKLQTVAGLYGESVCVFLCGVCLMETLHMAGSAAVLIRYYARLAVFISHCVTSQLLPTALAALQGASRVCSWWSCSCTC